MTITDDMIERAMKAWKAVALGREPWAPEDAMRAALTAALAAQPVEPPMSACPHGVPHRWPCDECDAPQPQPAGEVTVTRRQDGSIAAVTRTDAEGRVLSVIAECQRKPAEAVAVVRLMERGGNAGLATVIHEIDDPPRERLQPGTKLYAAPQPARVPLTQHQIDDGYIASNVGANRAAEGGPVERPVRCLQRENER